ncbi:MAG: hypothetical protein KC501_22715, partial [Myxococcales bacterium]|nr:hypothetical protein [Myxococcales bacterium]
MGSSVSVGAGFLEGGSDGAVSLGASSRFLRRFFVLRGGGDSVPAAAGSTGEGSVLGSGEAIGSGGGTLAGEGEG